MKFSMHHDMKQHLFYCVNTSYPQWTMANPVGEDQLAKKQKKTKKVILC